MDPLTLRIFISSPGDVVEERFLAARVLERLQGEFGGRVVLEPMLWEHEPLLASATWQVQIPQPSNCDIVVCILWARLGTRLPDEIRRPDGTVYESGTAYEFEDALAGHKAHGKPELLVYRKTAVPTLDLTNEDDILDRLAQKKALDQFIQKWFEDPVKRIGIAPYHPFAHSAQFEELLTRHLRKLIERRLPQPEFLGQDSAAAPPASAAITWTHGSPYRGLEPFNPEHAAVFAGRTRVVGEVLQAMRAQATAGRAFVLVIGASGAGKSSLVRAGVLPLLTQPGVIEGVGVWRWTILRPTDAGPSLAEGLAGALLKAEALPELAADGTSATDLASMLRQTPQAAAALVKGALSQAAAEVARKEQLEHQPEARLALVVDQMEELFTQDGVTADERLMFAEALASLACGGRVLVIATLRSDLYHCTQELPAILELKTGAGLYDLLPPNPAEVAQMIRDPARASGLRFEIDPATGHGLDDVLIDAAAANPGNLALLQFTLAALYETRTASGLLTFKAYEALGGLEGAIASRAEATFQTLSPETQAAFPRVFRHLVRVSGDEDGTVARQTARVADLDATPASRTLVAQFIAARLLTSDRAHDGEAVVALAHEALLRHWPRLKAWLDEDRDLLRIKSRVQTAAAHWHTEGRRADLLLPAGKPLEEAMPLMSSAYELPAQSREFLQASLARRTRMQQLRRLAVAGLAVLTLISVATAISAIRANSRTQIALAAEAKSRKETETERLKGLAREAVLNANQGDPLTARDKLFEAIAGFPEGSTPAWFSWAVWDLFRQHPFPLAEYQVSHKLGKLSFIPGHDEAIIARADGAGLQRIDLHTGRALLTYDSPEEVSSTQITPDGSLVLGRSAGSTLHMWDAASGELRHTVSMPEEAHIIDWSVSDDSRYLITANQDERAHVYDLQSGAEVETYSGHTQELYSVALSPDHRYTLTGSGRSGDKHPLRLWDRATQTQLRTFDGHLSGVFSLDFAPDSRRALSGSYDGTMRLWDVSTGQELRRFEHGTPVDELFYLRDGRRAVALSRDGVVHVWDTETGEELRRWVGDPNPYIGVTVDGDAAHLMTCDNKGTFALWRMEPTPEYVTLQDAGAMRDALIEPEGRWLAGVTSTRKGAGIWDLATGKLVRTFKLPHEDVEGGTAVALSPNQRQLAVGGSRGELALFDLDHTSVLQSKFEKTWALQLAYTPDGHGLLMRSEIRGPEFAGVGWILRYLDAESLEPRWEHRERAEGPGVAWAGIPPDGSCVVTLNGKGALELRDFTTGNVTRSWEGNSVGSGVGKFNGTGEILLMGGSDRTLRLWKWREQREILTLPGEGPGFMSVAMSPDDQLVISVGWGEHTVRVWGVEERAEFLKLPFPPNSGERTLLSRDGGVLAQYSYPNESRAWHLHRAADHIAFSKELPAVYATLAEAPDDPESWAYLGRWYAFQGEWRWAVVTLERAQEGGIDVDPVLLGRCHWMLDQRKEAAANFRLAVAKATDDAERRYLSWCVEAIENPLGN